MSNPLVDAQALLRNRAAVLCDTLAVNKAERHPKMLGVDSFALEAGKAGQRYLRIVHTYASQRSVHAFVDTTTGALVKAAGWKAPAKRSNGELQSKYNLLDDESFAQVLAECDWSGRYLYVR